MPRYRLVYDDRCGLCRAWVRWVKSRDRLDLIHPIACSEYFGKLGTEIQDCNEVKLISSNGIALSGGEAIPAILRCLPGYKIVGVVLGWRILKKPLRWGYRVLAQKRFFLSALLGNWSE